MSLLAGLAAFLLAGGVAVEPADLALSHWEMLGLNGILATLWGMAAWQDRGSGVPAGLYQLLSVPLFLLYLTAYWGPLYAGPAAEVEGPAQNLVKVVMGFAFVLLPLFLMVARPGYTLLRDTGILGGREEGPAGREE